MELDLKHITKADRQKVYPPSQDTFLLMDAIGKDLDFLYSLNPTICIEIGVGSGAVLASLSANPLINAVFIGVDINPSATGLAKATFDRNSCKRHDFITMDVFKGLNINAKADVIICNPPYVITSPEEYHECQMRKDISSSFAGGENGREFIDKLLFFAREALTDNGVLYMLFEEHNGNFEGLKLSEQRAGCEGLSVIRMNKSQVSN